MAPFIVSGEQRVNSIDQIFCLTRVVCKKAIRQFFARLVQRNLFGFVYCLVVLDEFGECGRKLSGVALVFRQEVRGQSHALFGSNVVRFVDLLLVVFGGLIRVPCGVDFLQRRIAHGRQVGLHKRFDGFCVESLRFSRPYNGSKHGLRVATIYSGHNTRSRLREF